MLAHSDSRVLQLRYQQYIVATDCHLNTVNTLSLQDNALPAGTALTPQSLAGVVGCVRDVSIPLILEDHQSQDRSETCEEGEDVEGDDNRVGGRLVELVVKLREVNGEGVMSGVKS